MEVRNGLLICHQRLHSRSFVFLFLFQLGLSVSFHSRLVSDGLGVCSPLLGSILHKLLILLLCLLLKHFHLSHLSAQVLQEKVHHGHNTIALLRLLGISTPCLRWGWRGHLAQTNACSCNASWRSSWCQ